MTRDLLFMPDYAGGPLWDASNESMVSLEFLPLPEELREAVASWCQRWTRSANAQLDVEGEVSDAQEADALDREAGLLCERLRGELGQDWRIGLVTFDAEGQRYAQWDPASDPVAFPPGAGA